MASSIEIRPVLPLDTSEVLRIVGDVFQEYGMTYAPDGWDKDLSAPHAAYPAPDATFLVATRGSSLLGMAGGHIEKYDGRPVHAELHRLYLDLAARGLGLGARLCGAIEAWARDKDIPKMVLWSDVRFTHAHALYRKRGYRIFGSRILGDPDQSVEFGMERDLAAPLEPATEPLAPHLRNSIQRIPAKKASESVALWRKTLFTACGIMDARELVAEGRMNGHAHVLPNLSEIFHGVPMAEIEILVTADKTVVGFASGEQVLWHPSCG